MAHNLIGTAGVLFRLWPSSRFIVTISLLSLAVTLGAAYWFRLEILAYYRQVHDFATLSFGLGIVIAPAWVMFFLLVKRWTKSWLRRIQICASSLPAMVFLLGFLSMFQAETGPLAAFTTSEQTSLGGKAGELVLGPGGWQGVLLLAAALLLTSSISVPKLTLRGVTLIGAALVIVYVWSFVAFGGVFSIFRRIYRFNPESDSSQPDQISTPPPPHDHTHYYADPEPKAVTSKLPTVAEIEPHLTFDAPDIGEEDHPQAENTTKTFFGKIPSEELLSNPSIGTRFNTLWNSSTGNIDSDPPSPTTHMEKSDIWDVPAITLLEDAPQTGITDEQMSETADTIKTTLGDYGVEVEIGQIQPGPAVTMYGLLPGWIRKYKQVKATDEQGLPLLDASGKPKTERKESKTRVKVDSILSREKDLALALKTPSIRIETPVMGESLVGVEVPNPEPDLVTLRGVMESREFQDLRLTAKLPIALGKGSGGETVVIDLAGAPHMLVAGATGSGKSVCLNTIISCLIKEKSPQEMRLLLIDPKRVELTPYNGIPHLLTPVVVETDQVVALLRGLIQEMLDRYRRMENHGVRNIESFNNLVPLGMPYLVVAVDELADLMMSASFDVEQALCRLAQLGRATGIHLIVATQRPSVDVVTGLIKANFPSRISFGVTSQIDSRTILDSVGAEKLLGRGDMLYLGVEASRPERVQGVFISDREIGRLVEYWQKSPLGPLENISLHITPDDSDEEVSGRVIEEHRDELIAQAIELAHQNKKLSTSLLQRRLRIGYPRAARLMDTLEEDGVVGPQNDGAKSRDVIISQI